MRLTLCRAGDGSRVPRRGCRPSRRRRGGQAVLTHLDCRCRHHRCRCGFDRQLWSTISFERSHYCRRPSPLPRCLGRPTANWPLKASRRLRWMSCTCTEAAANDNMLHGKYFLNTRFEVTWPYIWWWWWWWWWRWWWFNSTGKTPRFRLESRKLCKTATHTI